MLGVQFYARGMFASPAIGWCSSRKDAGLLGQIQKGAWALSAVLHSSLDWPIRRISQGDSSSCGIARMCIGALCKTTLRFQAFLIPYLVVYLNLVGPLFLGVNAAAAAYICLSRTAWVSCQCQSCHTTP